MVKSKSWGSNQGNIDPILSIRNERISTAGCSVDLLGEWDENIRTSHYIYFHLIILNVCFLYYKVHVYYLVSLVAQMVKSLPTMRETWVWSLAREDPLEKEMATHSSILAWRIPWTEEPGRLQSMGSQRVRQDWATKLNSFILDALSLSLSTHFL